MSSFRLNFVGDVMLGRLVDGLFPQNVSNAEHASHVQKLLQLHPNFKDFSSKSPWGTTLPLFLASDLNLINLETAVTTHPKPWPDKVFNYRMHPANIAALKEAKIDYASLANNHTLDFCEEGLVETVKTLEDAGVAFAGAGLTRGEALQPAVLRLPQPLTAIGAEQEVPSTTQKEHIVHVYSASDHPQDWSSVPSFNLIDYSPSTYQRLKELLTSSQYTRPSLKIFSIHWGPNYSWHPNTSIRRLAHFLVDECGVDIIHGHSSHHIQGVEIYGTALIIYGCGDFVDDYAVNEKYRNNMSALWRVTVEEKTAEKLAVRKLELVPTAIRNFQAQRLQTYEQDHRWVCDKLRELSMEYGTEIEQSLGDEGQLVIHLPK